MFVVGAGLGDGVACNKSSVDSIKNLWFPAGRVLSEYQGGKFHFTFILKHQQKDLDKTNDPRDEAGNSHL